MKYSNILRLAGKKEKAPSLEPVKWTRTETERKEKGLCVTCGENPTGKTSYLCPSCESSHTTDDIASEIQTLRKRILESTKE